MGYQEEQSRRSVRSTGKKRQQQHRFQSSTGRARKWQCSEGPRKNIISPRRERKKESKQKIGKTAQ